MELFIFIAFQLLMEVQSYSSLQKPFISYNGDDVQPIISCEIPSSVGADFTCSLYTEDILLHSQRKQSGERLCMFYLKDLFTRPENRRLSCDYSLNTEPEPEIRSSRSDTITVRSSPQKPFISYNGDDVQPIISCEIPSSVRADFTCSLYTEDILLHSQRKQSGEHLCMFYLKDLFTRPENRRLSCDYSLNTEPEPEIRSLRSDTITVRVSNVTSTLPDSMSGHATMAVSSTTETSTSSRTDTWFIVLVSTGVGVILTGFICLCWFARIKRRKPNKMRSSSSSDVPSQRIGMSSGPAETYSLITSVPASSQPISVGLEHPDSHQDNTPDPTATSSFIMAENSMYQPSEVLVNKQQKQRNTEENENVYHLYCTIPDRPVQSNAADQVYSLVKM